MTTLESRKSSGRSPLRLGLFLIPFSVASALAVSAFITFATNMRAETCVTPRSGLVSWWPGDGNANDIVGSNNNGTLENGATFSSGEVEQAFSFDGVDDYVVIPNIVNAWPEGTIEAWINY